MKTKYILHGGLASEPNKQNDLFFKEILKGTDRKLTILLVLFSKEPDRVKHNMEEDIFMFNKNKSDKALLFELAREESFIKQIKKSDIIYFHGGQTTRLINTLTKFPDFKEHIKGKIIAAESAGVYALSKSFYSNITNISLNGTGVIPINAVCHYSSGDEKGLDTENTGLQSVLLPEYEHKVIFF
ncbi:Type 1 glutamine amidotransferase-like domain-containing protein [Patescibacteria group bacterium]|nr:Type 1 glutamine amidotransferase-like domain-containing protein [Patescibacteria group bacterium]MBU1868586.1 Type 1 glutamine amidotransferase-like domain-containing protein [Patescibacteria group bacterium]